MAKTLMEDDLNRRLVALLQQEGRMSHAELAERLGVSRPTIIDRVKRLEADGILAGYAARVAPAAVGRGPPTSGSTSTTPSTWASRDASSSWPSTS